jgi:hypothetical protein
LLGEKAEQEFSLREKWFAENIFVPYLGQKFKLEYDKNLYYFSVSFLWRILILELRRDSKIKDKWYYQILIKAEQEWKYFLAKGVQPEKFNKFCLFFTDRVKHNNSDLKGADFYFTRLLDGTIVDNAPQTCLLVYGKFNRFIFWSVLKNYGDEKGLHDVEINPSGGKFYIPQKIEYFPILSFLGNRIREIDKLQQPSDEQQKKIEHEILKDPVAFWKSDLGQSLFNDKFNLDL